MPAKQFTLLLRGELPELCPPMTVWESGHAQQRQDFLALT